MSLYSPPQDLQSEVWSGLPGEFRITDQPSGWGSANKPGHIVDSFLEGPSFDRDGNLYLVDIPWGRVFRVSPNKEWTLVCDALAAGH